jgi:hypothetical protein
MSNSSNTNISKFNIREWLVPPVLVPLFFGLLILATVLVR